MSKHWAFHPGVRSGDDRTFGEKAADLMRQGMGSWPFFLGAGLTMFAWILTAGFGIDPTPFFRLNLGLSMLAGLQGSVLLIAAKRADRISAELATYHLEVSQKAAEMLTEIHHMMSELDRLVDPVVIHNAD